MALSVFDDFTYADPTDPTSPATLTGRDHQTAVLLEVISDCLALSRALAPLRASAPA